MTTKNIQDVVAEFLEQPHVKHTLKLIPGTQRELFISEITKPLTQLVKEVEVEVATNTRKDVMKSFFSMDLIASFLDFVPKEHKDMALHAYTEAVGKKIRDDYQGNK